MRTHAAKTLLMFTPSRRAVTRTILGAAGAALMPRGARPDSKSDMTLRLAAQADLRVLDPLWTTAYVTRNHGYMVFDTLFALDAGFQPRPQMLSSYSVSPDRLTYQFVLREGLQFHDHRSVTGNDCVASLKRWMVRDGHGQALAKVLDTIAPDGPKSFVIKLKEPFPLLIDALAKVSSLAPFIMPARLAETDPYKQISEAVGSGPFVFSKAEFEPGHKVVYLKNVDYVPRDEAPSWGAGGKHVMLDRVEWLYLPDAATKAAALDRGEIDWWENPSFEMLPVLRSNPEIVVTESDPLGNVTMVRFNHLFPPFNNEKIRQAVLMVVRQADFMHMLVGENPYWKPCPSFFTCGTPMANEAGSELLTGPRDVAEAKAQIAAAGYAGEKVIVLDPVDQPNPHVQAVVIHDVLLKLGLNAELFSAEWGTIITRRASKEPPDKGGWNVFGTGWVGIDMLDPVSNLALQANGDRAWFGWPRDDRTEELRAAWLKTPDLDERKRIAAAVQARAFETVPYLPTGQYMPVTAYRTNLRGIVRAPFLVLWDVEKVIA